MQTCAHLSYRICTSKPGTEDGVGRGGYLLGDWKGASQELKIFSENARQNMTKRHKVERIFPFWWKRIQPPFRNSLHVCKWARGGRGERWGCLFVNMWGYVREREWGVCSIIDTCGEAAVINDISNPLQYILYIIQYMGRSWGNKLLSGWVFERNLQAVF